MRISDIVPVLALAVTASASACDPPAPTASGWGPGGSWETSAAWGSIVRVTPTASWSEAAQTWVPGGQDWNDWSGDDTDYKSVASVMGQIGGRPDGPWKAISATSYGGYAEPTAPPFPTAAACINKTLSTSDDAKANPGMPNGPYHRGCWDGNSGWDINTPPGSAAPDTGNTVKYYFEITNTTHAPCGVEKLGLLINNQYPGPLIEANWGDYLEITVKNSMQDNGTSIHWHGFRQEGTNTQDGVNGITECPLAPGDSKTYRFRATSFGTTWYHSHFSAQYGDGTLGPVIIHGPASANYDIDLGTVMVADYYDQTVYQNDWFAHHFGPPTPSNYMINGKNIMPDLSSGERATFTFTPGKKHLMRFISTALDGIMKIQIDGHNLTVISTDFVPIVPFTTKELNIAIGQRYDVIVEANQPVASYYMRACEVCTPQVGNDGLGTANAVVQYTGAASSLPTNGTTPSTDGICGDEDPSLLVPIATLAVDDSGFAASASQLPVALNLIPITEVDHVNRWYLNGVTQNIDWLKPTIAQAITGNDTFAVENNVIVLEKADVWVFWIVQNQFFVPHPMHLHGHDFSLLGQGSGTFDVSADLGSLNFVNPPRRDVATLPASGWLVIAFQTDNPGAWLMHCHIAWHVGEGLALQFLERPADLPAGYTSAVTGSAFQDTCANFNNYVATAAYPKSDSGLKRRDGWVEYPEKHLAGHGLHKKDVTRRHVALHRERKLHH